VTADWWALTAGAVQGVAVIATLLVAVFAAVTVLAGAKKLHRSGPSGARSLDDLVGQERFSRFLPPDAPRGTVDQLDTPELREAARRQSS
jgi:hypothetical protein